ncbi:MAG: hypothetical protein M1836_002257 [Candelina mexicana]|nr:MAG: hypothetical protein M1836_002257 [Candelina mexicana]
MVPKSEQFKEDVVRLENELHEANSRNGELQIDLDRQINQIASLDRSLRTVSSQNDQLRDEMKELRKDLQSIENDFAREQDQKYQLLDNELRYLAKIEELHVDLRSLRNDLANVRYQNAQLQDGEGVYVTDIEKLEENLRSMRMDLTEGQEQICRLEHDLVVTREHVQKLESSLNKEIVEKAKIEKDLSIANEDLAKHVEERGKLLTQNQETTSKFHAEVSKILGISDDTCWHTLERLGIKITRGALQSSDYSTIRFDFSVIYGRTPKRFTTTAKMARIAAKLVLSLTVKPLEYWGVQLSNLWRSWDAGILHSSREELYWVIFSLIRGVFVVGKGASLNVWLACQLGCSLLRCAPPNLDMSEFFAHITPNVEKEANILISAGYLQLQVADKQRTTTDEFTDHGTILGSIRAFDSEARDDYRSFTGLRNAERLSACIVLPPESVLIIAKLADGTSFIWHNTRSACSFFLAKFYLWVELQGASAGELETWKIDRGCNLNIAWLRKNGITIGRPSESFKRWNARNGSTS